MGLLRRGKHVPPAEGAPGGPGAEGPELTPEAAAEALKACRLIPRRQEH